MRFVTEFPFLKITGLLNFNIDRYISSRHLELGSKNAVEKVEGALRKAFKIIGMKVDVSKFSLIEKALLEEMRELLYTPTLTFNLDIGLNFSIQNSDLYKLNRMQMIKGIERMRMYCLGGSENSNMPIDVLFGDEEYIRDKLFEIRGSNAIQNKIKGLKAGINCNRIRQVSEKMKEYYEKCIQEETQKYLLEHNIRVTREAER